MLRVHGLPGRGAARAAVLSVLLRLALLQRCSGMGAYMVVDGVPQHLSIPADKNSPQDMVQHKKVIGEWCASLRIGFTTPYCVHTTTDYVQSYRADTVQPCHADSFAFCEQRMSAAPALYTAPPDEPAANTAELQLSPATAMRIRRQQMLRSTHTLPAESLCSFAATVQCSLRATLVVDLNCDDRGVVLGRVSDDYKYICVSGSHELGTDHASFFNSPNKEFIVADVQSPDIIALVRGTSRLWLDSDVAAVVALWTMEFQPYEWSLSFLQSIKHSGVAFLIGTNSVGLLSHNPVRLSSLSGHTPLNFQRFPFQLGETWVKWRQSYISMLDMIEAWNISSDVPSGYPYYYDDLVCGPDATIMSQRTLGPRCSIVDTSSSTHWAMFVHRTQGSVSSQSGQDGMLQYIFKHIGTTNRYFVEFGFNGPTYLDDTGANSNFLYKTGWRGLLLDGANSNPDINLHTAWIEPETIVSVFDRHGVPSDLDYLSIDIDSTDLWIFRAIVSSGRYRPRVITVEYNSNYPLEATLCAGPGYLWKGDRIGGTALLPLKMVGDEFGYSLVDIVPYLDAVFVRTDLLNGSAVPDFETWRPFTSKPVHEPAIRTEDDIRKYVVDYAEWSRNGHDILKAMGDAVLSQIQQFPVEL